MQTAEVISTLSATTKQLEADLAAARAATAAAHRQAAATAALQQRTAAKAAAVQQLLSATQVLTSREWRPFQDAILQ